jgi:hypothetical protein
MTRKTRGRTMATPKTSDNHHATPIHSGIKAAIVRLAVWGLIPASFATWLIQRWGLKDA